MKEIIYTAGQISINKPETYTWREYVDSFFLESEKFEVINPCGNKFNQGLLKRNDKDSKSVYKIKGTELITPKDFSYLKRSTMCIVNLNHYDENKKIIGSFFELSYYYFNPEKSVIAIGSPDSDIYNHPFVKSTIDILVADESQACELITKFF